MGQPDRDFTLRQLRTFICAARAGSFSHAAAELGISQPAVSDQIALLEDRLGHTLFVRRLGTTPQLTAEGVKLLETAGTLIDTSKSMRCGGGQAADAPCPHLYRPARTGTLPEADAAAALSRLSSVSASISCVVSGAPMSRPRLSADASISSSIRSARDRNAGRTAAPYVR